MKEEYNFINAKKNPYIQEELIVEEKNSVEIEYKKENDEISNNSEM